MTHNPTPNAPRIALCISGQPRSFEAAFPYIKKNLIDCNPNVDVFLHFWYDEKNIGMEYKAASDTMGGKAVPIEIIETPKRLKELYKPVCMQYEPQEDFSTDAQRCPEVLRNKTNTFGSLSMWTSIYRCNKLKQNHEREVGKVYDCVIRMRFDAIILVKVLAKNIDTEFVHGFLPVFCFDEYGNKAAYLFDQILVSSSRNMDIVSNLIENIFTHLPQVGLWNNEDLLYYHIHQNKISIKTHGRWRTILVRRESAKQAILHAIIQDIKSAIIANISRLFKRNKITRLIYQKVKKKIKLNMTMKKKYFISIIWGFPQYFHNFAKEEHYHIHALSVAKDMGFQPVVIIKNEKGIIESDPLFDSDTKIIYYKNPVQYIFLLCKYSLSGAIFYVNSVEILSLIVPIVARKTIFMGHTHPVRQSKLKQIIFNFSMRLFSRIRLNNNEEKEFLLKQGIAEKKLWVAPLSISLEKYKVVDESAPRNDLVYFGNITTKKNLPTIIRAGAIVAEKYPDLALHLIGKIYDEFDSEIEGQLNVIKYGFIKNVSDVNEILNKTSIYINSSFDEGMCVAVYNAALAGNALCLPEIMSFVGVFNGKALFHKVTDYEQLAKNITYYIENPEIAREHNKLIREMIIKEYNYNVISDKMNKLFTF